MQFWRTFRLMPIFCGTITLVRRTYHNFLLNIVLFNTFFYQSKTVLDADIRIFTAKFVY